MKRSTIIRRPLLGLLALCFLQAAMQAAPGASSLGVEAWGGERRITLDKHGDFDVEGTFVSEHGGPVRREENPQPATAHYSGHVDGDTMSLTVTLDKETVGVFTLTRGSHPILKKCR